MLDDCSAEKVMYASTEFGIFSFLCNVLDSKRKYVDNTIGSSIKDEISITYFGELL